MIRRHPSSPLSPYPTLFRSHRPRIPVGQRPRAAAVSDEQHGALRRLERRVDVLEQMVRRPLAAGAPAERITPAPAARAVEVGRAHALTPVTATSRMTASACT